MLIIMRPLSALVQTIYTLSREYQFKMLIKCRKNKEDDIQLPFKILQNLMKATQFNVRNQDKWRILETMTTNGTANKRN